MLNFRIGFLSSIGGRLLYPCLPTPFRGRKRHINIGTSTISRSPRSPILPAGNPIPPGRVPGRKRLCSLGSAHSTSTFDPWPPVGRPPPPTRRETPPPARAVTGKICLCLCAFSFPEEISDSWIFESTTPWCAPGVDLKGN